jgi:hypothetical protein
MSCIVACSFRTVVDFDFGWRWFRGTTNAVRVEQGRRPPYSTFTPPHPVCLCRRAHPMPFHTITRASNAMG